MTADATSLVTIASEAGGILVAVIAGAWRLGGRLGRIETNIEAMTKAMAKADLRMDRFEKRQGELVLRQGRLTDAAVAVVERSAGVEHNGDPLADSPLDS